MSLSKTYDRYIDKYVSELSRQLVKSPVNTEMIIVVPVHDEYKYLQSLLKSLQELEDPGFHTEIFFVVNEAETAAKHIFISNDACVELINKIEIPSFLSSQVIELRSVKGKHAGVGLARKTGMDAAVINFNLLKRNGIIVCLDADCQVDSNYLIAIYDGMSKHPKALGCSIYFEHPLNGEHSNQIIDYELHLRYFIDIQKSINLPYAIQTVGSSMAVRSGAYAAYGGMNKRQAGEDFYFLQKFISVGGVFELNDTCVRPSDRSSSRVPFGTGKAIKDMLNQEEGFYTYSMKSFEVIDRFLKKLDELYDSGVVSNPRLNDLEPKLVEFLKSQDWDSKIEEIRKNTKNFESFKKRFFKWFNAFLLMKCLHYLRDNAYPNAEVGVVAQKYIRLKYKKLIEVKKDQLTFLRLISKGGHG
jgi:glycosyltransferase involved in cell wall biosynthesis